MKLPTIKNNPQVVRFIIVGLANTAIDFGLLFTGKSLGLPIVIANVISTGAAFIFSFVANRKYTFKSTDSNVFREVVLFVIVTLFGLWVLQTLIIQLMFPLVQSLVSKTDVALLIAKLIATVVSLTWNYLLYSRLVFKKQ